jgi:primosomal protein N' (replication factor Y)
MIIQVALPQPLRKTFDYLLPAELAKRAIAPGMRVQVPWGKQQLIGVVIGTSYQTQVAAEKLRAIHAILDSTAIINPSMLQFCLWAADYYHHPIGEVIALALPPVLRRTAGKSARNEEIIWQLTAAGLTFDATTIKRSAKQRQALLLLQQHPTGITIAAIKAAGISDTVLKALQKQTLVEKISREIMADNTQIVPAEAITIDTPNHLIINAEQQQAITAICQHLGQFTPIILDGITGSGKTEVYLRVIEQTLQQSKQALVLVPEIGLTPQTVERFRKRFPNTTIAVFNSSLTANERLRNWLDAQQGKAGIIIGTRSALFTPMPALGLIIVDEAHDASFKQQDGLRYSARDLAMKRGQLEKVPVILGSATHALESVLQVKKQKFMHLPLTQRAGDAIPPTFEIVDIKHQPLTEGLCQRLIATMQQHLADGGQALLFINRRGFAPVLMCHDCGWIAGCQRCDARLTLHYDPYQLHCHHCDTITPAVSICQHCRSKNILALGSGTERIERCLSQLFPQYTIARIDRDTTRTKASMEEKLENILAGKAQILIGTQMLAKGHHFPNVTLVGILNTDQGLCSADFRATERLAQLITQVSGRAGRAARRGHVILQTHYPNHPLLLSLLKQGYQQFADLALQERHMAGLPPFSSMALIRAEAPQREMANGFLQEIRQLSQQLNLSSVTIMGPIPAVMEKRAGKFRAQLLLQAPQRADLQSGLKQLVPVIETIKLRNKVRWHIDVDPLEPF